MSKLKDIFHMNGYSKEIFYINIEKFLSEKLMTTNSCQNMNDETKYTVIIPFTGYTSMTFKNSPTRNLKSINKDVVQYLRHLKFKTTFLQKMKLLWPYKQMLFIFLMVLVIRTKPILVKQRDIWKPGLGSIFYEIQPFFEHISSCNTCNHSTIVNFHILSHGSNDFDYEVKEALCIRTQIPLLKKHLH